MEIEDLNKFYEAIPGLLSNDELKYREHICRGFNGANKTFWDIFTGANFGKVVITLE